GRGGGAPARGARVLPSPAGLRRPAGQREVAAEEVARGAGAGRPVAPAPGARALSPAFPAPIRYFRRRLVLRGIDPAGQVSNRSTAGALVRGRVARLVVRASGRLVGRFLGLHLGPPLLLPRAPLLVVIAATPVAGDGEILARDLLVEAQERAQRLDGHRLPVQEGMHPSRGKVQRLHRGDQGLARGAVGGGAVDPREMGVL